MTTDLNNELLAAAGDTNRVRNPALYSPDMVYYTTLMEFVKGFELLARDIRSDQDPRIILHTFSLIGFVHNREHRYRFLDAFWALLKQNGFDSGVNLRCQLAALQLFGELMEYLNNEYSMVTPNVIGGD